MTIQQMEYIVAVDTYRHFVKAAESCNVSQSTLSMMIKKLEEELDTIIFNRDSHPVKPTSAGEKIIAQAKVILFNTEQLRELTQSERIKTGGDVKMGVIPTVASYIVPELVKVLRRDSPDIKLHVCELQTCDIVASLQKAELDMAIMATPLGIDGLLEIPLYYEKFISYISPSEPEYAKKEIRSTDLSTEHLWMMKEGNCLRDQVLNFCRDCSGSPDVYEAGSIDNLIRIVDVNGGCTVIPELHCRYLTETQKKNVRPLVDPEVVREISIVIRKDYVHEGILNEVASAVKKIIPAQMIDAGLKKYAIRL